MESLRVETDCNYTTYPPNTVSLDEAKTWIGRRLTLRKPLLGFQPGTRCIVMCVVDFGDGILLWIKTDDVSANDVEQMELPLVSEYFRPVLEETQDHSFNGNGEMVLV